MNERHVKRVAIIGGGSIGIAFAIVFARAGWPVRLFDPDAQRRSVALDEIGARLLDLTKFNLLDEAVEGCHDSGPGRRFHRRCGCRYRSRDGSVRPSESS